MPQDNVTIAEWPSQTRLSGTENGDYWYAEQRGEVHCAGIIGKEYMAVPQLVDKLIKRSLADPIHAMIAHCSRDLIAYRRIVVGSEQNPSHR